MREYFNITFCLCLFFFPFILLKTHAESKTTVILHILVKHQGKVTIKRFKLDVLLKTLLKLLMKRVEKISNRAHQNVLSIWKVVREAALYALTAPAEICKHYCPWWTRRHWLIRGPGQCRPLLGTLSHYRHSWADTTGAEAQNHPSGKCTPPPQKVFLAEFNILMIPNI